MANKEKLRLSKEKQRQLNEKILQELCDFEGEYNSVDEYLRKTLESKFKSCSATYGETKNFFYLRSYNTIVCFIDKRNNQAYDIHRYIYGYTATSAQHIAKFCKWAYAGIKHTYYPV